MRIAKSKVAVVLTVGLFGVVAFGAGVVAQTGLGGQPGVAQPLNRFELKPIELPFTAFPELKPPTKIEFDPKDSHEGYTAKIKAARVKACPNIFGDKPIPIEPTDNVYRRLLKNQLNEARKFLLKFQSQIDIGRFSATEYGEYHKVATDMAATAIELWADDRKTQIAWLEEVVVLAKDMEQFTLRRVETGSDPSQQIHLASQHRLAAEATLWKAKNSPPAAPANLPAAVPVIVYPYVPCPPVIVGQPVWRR